MVVLRARAALSVGDGYGYQPTVSPLPHPSAVSLRMKGKGGVCGRDWIWANDVGNRTGGNETLAEYTAASAKAKSNVPAKNVQAGSFGSIPISRAAKPPQ